MSCLNAISFRVHYGGKFVEMSHKRYINGKLGFYCDFDREYVSYFEIKGIVANCCYIKGD